MPNPNEIDINPLVEILLDIPTIQNAATRNDVIAELPFHNTIQRRDATLPDARNMVKACLNYTGGIEALYAILVSYEDQSLGIQKLRSALDDLDQPKPQEQSGVGSQPAPQAQPNSSDALAIWREKLAFLQQQEALATDAAQKFAIKKQIEEAKAKIEALEENESAGRSTSLEVQTTDNSANDHVTPPPNIETPYGTMMPESPFYIERDADGTCSQTFGSDNPFTLYIQSPRQVGKSSLMQRMAHHARLAADTKIAFVDFEKFTQEQLGDLEEFLIELCLMIGDELGVEEEIDRYFASRRRSNLVKCSNYLSKHIVPAVQGPIVLAMDEVERVLGTPFQNDFFGMLRTWHNDRARDPNFARVSLFLSSSTEPELFIDNPNQSPFNVAQPVTLHDFSQPEVAQLNQLHDSPLSAEQVEQLMTLLAGHPFLTRLSLYLVATQQTAFDHLLTQATADDGPFGSHLNHFWRRLAETPDLQASLRQIQRNQRHPTDRNLERLRGAGLVKRAEGKVVMRNDLYARYFEERMNG